MENPHFSRSDLNDDAALLIGKVIAGWSSVEELVIHDIDHVHAQISFGRYPDPSDGVNRYRRRFYPPEQDGRFKKRLAQWRRVHLSVSPNGDHRAALERQYTKLLRVADIRHDLAHNARYLIWRDTGPVIFCGKSQTALEFDRLVIDHYTDFTNGKYLNGREYTFDEIEITVMAVRSCHAELFEIANLLHFGHPYVHPRDRVGNEDAKLLAVDQSVKPSIPGN